MSASPFEEPLDGEDFVEEDPDAEFLNTDDGDHEIIDDSAFFCSVCRSGRPRSGSGAKIFSTLSPIS